MSTQKGAVVCTAQQDPWQDYPQLEQRLAAWVLAVMAGCVADELLDWVDSWAPRSIQAAAANA